MNPSNQYTAQRAKFVFGVEMKACPKCGGYNLRNQTPIKMDEPIAPGDSVRQIVGKWARSVKSGATPLQGPVFVMCFGCGHCGPSVDCTGRTSEDVGRDPEVARRIKDLWNSPENAA